MSSRLNPRDYDLGELRDAVRDTPRRRDLRADARRDDGRRDARRDDRRTDASTDGVEPAEARPSNGDSPVEDQLSNGASPTGKGSSKGATPDDAPSPPADAEADGSAPPAPAPDGQYPGEERAESHSSPGPSSARRAGQRADTALEGDDRPSVGRVRRIRRRFARSSSRDRTADGAPRRRGAAGADDGPGWRPGGRTGRSDHSGRSDDSGDAGSTDRSPRTHAGSGTSGFELLSVGSRGDVERPYLDRLPQGYRAQVEIFAWLEELLATCGREATLEALEYYEAVGWLSGESRERLAEFVEGLTAAAPPDPRPLEVDDHRNSLRYVARLARRVDR